MRRAAAAALTAALLLTTGCNGEEPEADPVITAPGADGPVGSLADVTLSVDDDGCMVLRAAVVVWTVEATWDGARQAVVFEDGAEAVEMREPTTLSGGLVPTTADLEQQYADAGPRLQECIASTGTQTVAVVAPGV